MPSEVAGVVSSICEEHGFTLLGERGEGAFKWTFQVFTEDRVNKALKVYKSGAKNERTDREVDALLRCNHSSIASFDFLSSHTHNGAEHLYSVEEYLGGGSLSERMDGGTLPRSDLIRIGQVLSSAVEHLWERGLVHRDIKPDNIMFRESSDDPVLVDLGLVRDLTKSSVTKTYALRGPGTPYFASPEQLVNAKSMIDWRSDQFSIGIVLAVCGSHLHPYEEAGDNMGDTVERVARRQGPSESFEAWAESERLSPVARMVEPWPVRRFRSPSDLTTALI